jgi:hypothetical protein
MKYTLEIQKILYQVDDNKSLSPKDKIHLLKQAAAFADENEDIEWGYDVRLLLIRECYALASASDLITEFNWVLNAYESHPDWFNENDFLWQYKWVLREMYENPQVSMEQITAIMDDFKMRLLRNGYGLRAYYDRLYDETLTLGQYEKAKEYLDLRNESPDDAMGSCPACTLDYEIDYYLLTNQFEEGYNRAKPLIDKQYSCAHVPARTFCSLCYHADKEGKSDIATKISNLAEEEFQELFAENDESLLAYVAMLICYLFGVNEAKAWSYVEKTIPWYAESNAHAQYEYAAYLTEGLQKLISDAPVKLDLPSDFPLYTPAHTYVLTTLKSWFKAEAVRQAAAFDARNNCQAFTQRIEAL